MEDTTLVLSTAGSAEDAKRIARTLVEERLAACVNIVPIESVYTWEGKIVDESERLLVIKTTSARLHELETRLHAIHPYSVPEFVVVAAEHVSPRYLEWIAACVSR